jgi:hypothetical protein
MAEPFLLPPANPREPLAIGVFRETLLRPPPTMRFILIPLFAALLAAGPAGRAQDVAPAPDAKAELRAALNPRAATGDELAQLNTLLHKVADDYKRWAYTESRVLHDEKGRLKSDLLLRYDPSKPYAEQWTPLSVNGKPPSERELKKYREMGEKQAPPDLARPVTPDPKNRRRPSLGEVLDLPRSSVAAESATHLLFEIALLKFGNERFPPEKFQVLARVRKDGWALENISVKLRESFRSKLIVKVKSGEGSLDFTQIDPKHPPALVALNGDASASVLFVSIGGALAMHRTELKHVKPYDERFDVQIGTLKAIDF